jgi:hypothetical protein
MRKKLLIDEHPVQVLPSLAKIIGLNEAILLQQLHYWIQQSKVGATVDGIKWVYNTYDEWQNTFQFWSQRTIMRTVNNLKNIPIICITNEFNKCYKLPQKTNWFTILYSVIELIEKYISIYHPNGNLNSFHSDNLSLYMVTTCDYTWGQIVTMPLLYRTETTTETFSETTAIVFDKLVSLGFKKKDAKQILENYPEDYVNEKIRYLFFEINTNHRNIEKKSAWLFKALEKNYSAPANYEQHQDIRNSIEKRFLSLGPS